MIQDTFNWDEYILLDTSSILVAVYSYHVVDTATLFSPKGKVHKFRSFCWKKIWHPSYVRSLGDLQLSLLLIWLQKLVIVSWEKKLDITLDIQGFTQKGNPHPTW